MPLCRLSGIALNHFYFIIVWQKWQKGERSGGKKKGKYDFCTIWEENERFICLEK